MKYSVTKQFTFEAAHRLIKGYKGKCTNNHGHSWVIKLHLESAKLDEKEMVIDFQDMKALKTWIDDNLDHVSILWENDPMCEFIRDSGQRIYTTKGNPTSETIGEIILKQAMKIFNKPGIIVKCIEVNETCTSGAQVYS
jgi:6-pyruvoyltetrahydropterin/6-carboxytetrahydropterin synthase